MKQLSLVLCTLLLVVTVAHAQTPVRSESLTWKMYTVSGEDFSAALPTLPAMHTNYEFIERVRRNGKILQLGAYADGVVYTIYIHENPKPRQSLDEFVRQQTARSTIWDRAGARDLTLDGFAGKALSSKDAAGGMLQFFAAGDRLYEFAAFGAPVDDGRVQKFFSSVALKKKGDSVKVSDGPGLPYEPPVESGAPNGVADDKLFIGREVLKKARLGMKPEPTYTESARLNQITGTVVLKCVFASNGSVTNIRIVSGLPNGLTEKAIDAARKIKFIPAMKDGKYVSMWMQLEYNFNLY